MRTSHGKKEYIIKYFVICCALGVCMLDVCKIRIVNGAERETSGSKIGETVINISYPYFYTRGYPDPVIEKINGQIEKAVAEHCDKELCGYELSYEIQYESENILHILFEQTQYPWEAYPSEKSWGLTFDMETGDLLMTEES